MIVNTAPADLPAAVAERLAVLFEATADVLTVKVADVAPLAMDTLEGTVASAMSERRATVIPPLAAGLLMVTVPVELVPPTTDVGETARPVIVGALTARVAVPFVVPTVPVMVAVVLKVTGAVVTVKVATFVPAATVTVAGTVDEGSFEDKATDIVLPVATFPINVTVPVDEDPPTNDVGFRVTVPMNGGMIVKIALDVPPAVIVTVWLAATGVVATLNVAVVAPAATVTLAGTVADALLDAIETTVPPAGAAVPRVTVPTGELPPTTPFVLRVSVTETAELTVKTAV